MKNKIRKFQSSTNLGFALWMCKGRLRYWPTVCSWINLRDRRFWYEFLSGFINWHFKIRNNLIHDGMSPNKTRHTDRFAPHTKTKTLKREKEMLANDTYSWSLKYKYGFIESVGGIEQIPYYYSFEDKS